MAGIGFVLRKLSQRGDLSGVVMSFLYASVISSGPWLFTIMSLGLLVLIGNQFLALAELSEFRIIIIYNFAFSLVFSAPVFMVATRFLSDLIYARNVSAAPGLLLGALMLLFGLQAPIVIIFYLYYADLTPWVQLVAVTNYFLITGIWLVSVFMSALKEYAAISRTFGLGMLIALACTMLLAPYFSIAGMLMGFNLGLAYIFFNLIARVLAEYPGTPRQPFAFLRYFKSHWEIVLSGFVYNLAIWVDKWIMWFSPQRDVHQSGLVSYPHYDGAMFLSYLTIVPAIAVFTIAIETRFFEQYLRFYQDIQNHANYERIEKNHRQLWAGIIASARNIIILQLTIALGVILLAPLILQSVQASSMQLSMFRFGVLGAAFHVFTMFLMIVLSYFDARLKVLTIALVFLFANSLITWASLHLGLAWYGWGYAMAVIISFAVAYVMLVRHLQQLPYQTFIIRNESVK
ncbi:MAG: exopolysaccharide Pel transporter PelG [Gammaproteobacteria bacterium]|nr:exopolysaccharide Pel transporter PelG [Gammaproteobacteria bacterium]